MLRERVITALIMVTVFALMLFFAPELLWFAGIACLMAWAAVEWARLANFSRAYQAIYAMATPVLLAVLWVTFRYGELSNVFSIAIFSALVFWVVVVPIWLRFSWKVSNPLALTLFGWLALIPAGLCFLYLRQSPEDGWFLFGLLLVVWIADISAFFAGRAFGKHKLAPSISPGKTIEGAIGAWIGVSLYLLAVFFLLKPEVFSRLDVSIWEAIIFAFFLTYQSILGDLFESWIKRCAGVKDSGETLPGHGGILDRIDAILPTLPLQIVLLTWLYMHPI